MREAYEKGIQTTEKYPPKLFEMYCNKIIWNMFRVVNYGTYALIGIYILYLFIVAIIKLNRFTKTVKKPTVSFNSREREVLDELGYISDYETDDQSDGEKNYEKKNLLPWKKDEATKVGPKPKPKRDRILKEEKDEKKNLSLEKKDETTEVKPKPTTKSDDISKEEKKEKKNLSLEEKNETTEAEPKPNTKSDDLSEEEKKEKKDEKVKDENTEVEPKPKAKNDKLSTEEKKEKKKRPSVKAKKRNV